MASRPVSPRMLTCPRCGTPNREDAWFCNLCQEPFRKPSPEGAGPASPGSRAFPSDPRPVATAAPHATPASAVAAPRSAPPAVAPAARAMPGSAGSARTARGDRPGPMLPFDEAAAANARNTAALFAALFAALLALGYVIGLASGDPPAGVAVAAVVFAILASAAWFSGASLVLSAQDAREADPGRHRVLLNVVEEMAIAAGLPMPRVYVIETDGMNAFATGRTPGEASVVVTTGLADRLNREELQGVVAHEMAHIRSRDTLYNVCAAVLVGAVALLCDLFLRGSPFRGRGASPGPGFRPLGRGAGSFAFLLLGLPLALIAPLAAKLLRMSISRQREYHADAAAAGLTRNPLGLAAALEKIVQGGAAVPGGNRGTEHLFIVNPLRAFSDESSALTATHPPTERRIERLKAMAGIAVRS